MEVELDCMLALALSTSLLMVSQAGLCVEWWLGFVGTSLYEKVGSFWTSSFVYVY